MSNRRIHSLGITDGFRPEALNPQTVFVSLAVLPAETAASQLLRKNHESD